MQIGKDGVYAFYTEMPGNENKVGWGDDPAPHIHYDIECSGCAKNDVFSGNFKFWNKFYPKETCKLAACGTNIGPQHQATKTSYGGSDAYKYNIVLKV
jgi:hypothetical protein